MVSRTWKPRSGSCAFRSLARPAPNAEVLVHDHHRLRRLVGLIVDGDEIVERGLGDDAEARAEAERVLQPAGDDAVDHADVDDIGQVIARRGLAGGEADAAGVAADDGRDPGAVHLLDFGVAAFRRRLRVAEHRLDLGAAQRLDAAGRVDLLDRHHGADPALLAGIGQRAGDRMQHADLHRRALRAQHGRRVAGLRPPLRRRPAPSIAGTGGGSRPTTDETCVPSWVLIGDTNIGPCGLLYYPDSRGDYEEPYPGMNDPRTLIDKLWAAHEIVRREDGESLLWVDRHYVHEGSFHAFSRLAERGTGVAEPGLTFAVADHYVPTRGSRHDIANPEIARMVRQIEENAAKHGIRLFGLDDPRQGIVHVVGPEQGLTLPGLLIVCGDSHTSTHGALGAYAFGIGASEVAHVLMTQTIWQRRPKRMRITVDGQVAPGVAAKDIALAIIAHIGAGGATGYAVEYAGSAIRALSIEGRLTLCNMSIEAGARCGMIAPDDATFAYLKGRPYAPEGADFDKRRRSMVHACDRRRCRVRSGGRPRCCKDRPDRDLGHQPRGRAADRRERTRSGARAG